LDVRQFWIAHAGLLVLFWLLGLGEIKGEREEEDENEDRDIPSGRQSCGMVDWCTYLIVNRREVRSSGISDVVLLMV
jgi:hypothetical protein